MSIRLGIIGTGRIANRFADDAWQNLDVVISAVFNPHISSAQKFCDVHHFDRAVDDWNEFLNQIDAAYVAAPLDFHFEYSKKLLLAKKHVLCEKPMVVSKLQAEELFFIAEQNSCILMEGIKTAYSAGMAKVLELIHSGCIGEVKDVEACFTKLVKAGLREWTNIVNGGSFTELGTYGCYAIIKILGCNYSDLRFTSLHDENGVDTFTKIFFEYKGRATALVKAGIGVKAEGELIVSGTNGYILVRAPWWMPKEIEVHYEDTSMTEYYECEFIGNGLQYELGEFLHRIKGQSASEQVSKEQTIAISDIMEKFLGNEKKYRNI